MIPKFKLLFKYLDTPCTQTFRHYPHLTFSCSNPPPPSLPFTQISQKQYPFFVPTSTKAEPENLSSYLNGSSISSRYRAKKREKSIRLHFESNQIFGGISHMNYQCNSTLHNVLEMKTAKDPIGHLLLDMSRACLYCPSHQGPTFLN